MSKKIKKNFVIVADIFTSPNKEEINNNILLKDINFNILCKILRDHGWHEYKYYELINTETMKIKNKTELFRLLNNFGFLYLSGKYLGRINNIFYKYDCFLTNKINRKEHRILFDKDMLYNRFKTFLGDDTNLFLPYTYGNIYEVEDIDFNNKIYIAKPSRGWKGYGIKIIENQDALKEYIADSKEIRTLGTKLIKQKKLDDNDILKHKFLSSKFSIPNNDKLNEIPSDSDNTYFEDILTSIFHSNIVLQEYLDSPLLFNKRKFHLRSYLMIKATYVPETKDYNYNYSYFRKAKILTALDEYKKGDWLNHDIHDTHIGSTADDYYFPEDLIKYSNKKITNEHLDFIYKQMDIIGKTVCLIEKEHGTRPYEKTINAYDVLGVDLMILDNYSIKILEINSFNLGNGAKNPTNKNVEEFAYEYFNWIYKEGIEPLEIYMD